MKYAIVDGVRCEATPKQRGVCQACSSEVIAKCGKFMIWHWSHRSLANCDPWWEAETAWHRDWKAMFPEAWQEVVRFDPFSGEKHVADVLTAGGVVVEFQRSSIEPDEVRARESFYQRMVWVVDGTRGEFDPINFGLFRSRPGEDGMVSFHWYSRSKLFHRWLSHKPVFIDFGQQGGFWRICRFDPRTKKGVALLVNRQLFTQALIDATTDFSSAGGPAST